MSQTVYLAWIFYYGDVLKIFNGKCGSCINQHSEGSPGGSTQKVKGGVYLLTWIKHFNIMTININTSMMYLGDYQNWL